MVFDPRTITTTDKAADSGGVKALIYGGSGAGKTRLLASAPAPFIISAEKGLKSIRKFQLPCVEITTLDQLKDLHQWFYAGKDGFAYWTICIDSISEVAENILEREKTAGNMAHGKGYGVTADEILDQFRKFRDLPYRNIVMTAKMEYDKDGLSGMKIYQPMFPGNKLGQNAPYFVDEVFCLHAKCDASTNWQSFRYLQTGRNEQYVAKDRSDALAFYENADPATGGGLTFIFDKMKKPLT